MQRIVRAVLGATILAAATTACPPRAPDDNAVATPLDSARFYADADSNGAVIAAFDGVLTLYPRRAVIRIDVGTVERDAIVGNLTPAFCARESDGSWRVITAGRPLPPERWESRPGVVWAPLSLEVPLPDDADSSGGAVLLVLDRRSALSLATPVERLFIPLHVGRR